MQIGDPAQSTKSELVQALPFDYLLAMSGNVWRKDQRYVVYVKGAPEKILSRCKLTEAQHKQASTKLMDYARSWLSNDCLRKV